jgi:plastocyanin
MVTMRIHLALAAAVLWSGVARAETSGGGVIKGRVLVRGAAPAPRKVPLSADAQCEAQHPHGLEQSDFSISNGGLADVLVYLKSGVQGTFSAPAEPKVLDQKGCQYSPGLVAIQAGQALTIRNSDQTLHNVHFRPALNKEINVGQPRAGMESSRVFPKPEVLVPIGCDVHPWMRANLAVLSHPFFTVSTAGGAFEIRNVPSGTYEIEARHGKLKPVSAKVAVSGATTPVDVTLVIEPGK